MVRDETRGPQAEASVSDTRLFDASLPRPSVDALDSSSNTASVRSRLPRTNSDSR
jgi:hypothetical protein